MWTRRTSLWLVFIKVFPQRQRQPNFLSRINEVLLYCWVVLLGFLILFVVAVVVSLFLVLCNFLSKIVGTCLCFSLSQCVSESQTCKTMVASPVEKMRFRRFVFTFFCSTRNVNKPRSHSLNTKRTSRRNIMTHTYTCKQTRQLPPHWWTSFQLLGLLITSSFPTFSIRSFAS